MSVLGGNSGGLLDFSSTAAGRVPLGLQREWKQCELCPQGFYRMPPVMRRMGQKYCGSCVARIALAEKGQRGR